jgi:hypothetical protein
MGTQFDLSLLSDRQYEPNATPPAYPNTLSGKHLWMAELMMDGVVGSRDAIRREVQRQYAVSQNTPIRALIGSADDFVNGRTESVTHGELKQYVESVPDAAKGYFIDGPTQVTQETFELVDDVLTRGPTAISRDLGTTVGTLWSSPDARDQAFTAFERSFQECLDNPEKGGAASFKLAFSVLGGEEVAARSVVEWTKRAGSAGRLLGHLDDVNLGDASRLGTMTDTVGSRGADFLDEAAETALVRGQAEGLAQVLARTQSNVRRGPVLSLVRDRITGEVFDAQNLSNIPSNLHPFLASRLEEHLAANAGKLNPVWGVPGSHSEIWALNQALWRRKALGIDVQSLDDFGLYNVSLWRNRLGTPVPRCGNCNFLTDGVRELSGN